MRPTILLAGAVLLAIAVGTPRAGHCCRLGGRAGASSNLIVSVVASRGDARALTFPALSKMDIPAPSDSRLALQVIPTWKTVAGRTHAGFALSGRF